MRTIVSGYLGLLAATAVANPLERRQSTTAVVNFGNNTGTPQHLASGTLYGLPDVVSQIPDHFFSDIGWNYERAGGAQTSGKGWIAGLAAYKLVIYGRTVSNDDNIQPSNLIQNAFR